MLQWLKKNLTVIVTALVTFGVIIFVYGCEPKVPSLNNKEYLVSRAELQIELDNIMAIAKMRMLSLDKQDALRNIIMQNSLLLVQGQPFNPVGIITGIAAIYGIAAGGTNITKVVKEKIKKGKEKNGTT